MEILYTGLVSLAVAMLAFVLQGVLRENHKLKKEKEKCMKEEDTAVKDGVLSLLRSEMIRCHAKYTERQSITLHGYEAWKEMFKAYTALGGNGMVKHLNAEIEELEIKER